MVLIPFFIFFGILGIIWGVLWGLLTASSPREHRSIHPSEVEKIVFKINSPKTVSIQEERTDEDDPMLVKETFQQQPMSVLLSSVRVWAVIVGHFCNNWGFYVLLTWLPSYLHQELNYNMGKTGFVAVLPFLTMAIVSSVGGRIADLLISSVKVQTKESETGTLSGIAYVTRKTIVRKFFGAVGMSIPAVCLILINYTKNTTLAVIYIVCAVGGSGLSLSGYAVNHLDLGPKHAATFLGMTNFAGTIPGIVAVYITGYFLTLSSGWAIVFYLAASVYGFGVIFWLAFSTGKQIFE